MRIVSSTFPRPLLLHANRHTPFLGMEALAQAITNLESSSDQVYLNFVSSACTPNR